MKNKGFTLIELLAVIVILAIIALIATPIILNVIEKARQGAAESSALGYVDAAEKQVMINKVKNEESLLINEGEYTKVDLAAKNLNIKGDVTDALVLINNKGKVTEGKFCIDGYSIDYDGKKAKLSSNDYCRGIMKNNIPNSGGSDSSISENNQTTEEPATHKGIVYLDPTNLSKICTESDANANVNEFGTPTEIKTGCMKWYIFDDSGGNYKMILDHNTTARILWYDSLSPISYESSYLKPAVDALVTKSGWKVTPRLITEQELVDIVGKATGYFDSNFPVTGSFDETLISGYDWLYNNLVHCKYDENIKMNFGCSIEDNNTYTISGDNPWSSIGLTAGEPCGYWTSTRNENTNPYFMWHVALSVSYQGRSSYEYLNNPGSGIRPVIEVPKSLFN